MKKEVLPNVRRGLERDKMLFEVSYLAFEVSNSNLLRPMDSIVTPVMLELFSTNKLEKKANQKNPTGHFSVTFLTTWRQDVY